VEQYFFVKHFIDFQDCGSGHLGNGDKPTACELNKLSMCISIFPSAIMQFEK
jgi:hypothetical protein